MEEPNTRSISNVIYCEIPDAKFTRIEHPCVIRNIDKGLATIGGPEKIREALASEPQKPLALNLNPEASFRRPTLSSQQPAQDLLLRIKIPKRTGRVRKKGTNDPFEFPEGVTGPPPEPRVCFKSRDILRRLQDNKDRYKVEVMGSMNKVHRFRDLQDYQWSVKPNMFVRELQEQVLPGNFEKLKNWKPDLESKGPTDPDNMVPPSIFSVQTHPYIYEYKQNKNSVLVTDPDGTQRWMNSDHPIRVQLTSVRWNDRDIPKKPPGDLKPVATLRQKVQDNIKHLKQLMEKRPVLTKRYILNHIDLASQRDLNLVCVYVCYSFHSGPFKSTVVKYGVDPRSHPEYRYFQTLTFQIPPHLEKEATDAKRRLRRNAGPKGEKNYQFDGKSLSLDGNTWQFCDITDPLISGLLDEEPRITCEIRLHGWLKNGTYAKFRTVLRDKLETIYAGKQPRDEDYEPILKLPSVITTEHEDQIYTPKILHASEHQKQLMARLRMVANFHSESGNAQDKANEDEQFAFRRYVREAEAEAAEQQEAEDDNDVEEEEEEEEEEDDEDDEDEVLDGDDDVGDGEADQDEDQGDGEGENSGDEL